MCYYTGIWPEGADGTDINACVRANKQNLLASADDFGKVNLYAYPCSQPKVSNLTQLFIFFFLMGQIVLKKIKQQIKKRKMYT